MRQKHLAERSKTVHNSAFQTGKMEIPDDDAQLPWESGNIGLEFYN